MRDEGVRVAAFKTPTFTVSEYPWSALMLQEYRNLPVHDLVSMIKLPRESTPPLAI